MFLLGSASIQKLIVPPMPSPLGEKNDVGSWCCGDALRLCAPSWSAPRIPAIRVKTKRVKGARNMPCDSLVCSPMPLMAQRASHSKCRCPVPPAGSSVPRGMAEETSEPRVARRRRRLLLVVCDDLGYCPRRNRGIVECFLAGLASGASLIVNGRAAQDAARLAKT
ncbi:unnamed protein product [Lampetra fluviatilis]